MTRCWVRCWVLWWNQLLPFSPAYFLPSVPIPIKVMPCQALLWIFLSWTYSWRPWREMLSWIQNVLCATQIFSLLKWYQYQTMHILSLIPFVRNRGRSILEHIDLQLARNPMVVNQQSTGIVLCNHLNKTPASHYKLFETYLNSICLFIIF